MKTITRKYLPDRLRKIQKEIYFKAWEQYKQDFTMTELAQVFRTPVNNFFRLVKK